MIITALTVKDCVMQHHIHMQVIGHQMSSAKLNQVCLLMCSNVGLNSSSKDNLERSVTQT